MRLAWLTRASVLNSLPRPGAAQPVLPIRSFRPVRSRSTAAGTCATLFSAMTSWILVNPRIALAGFAAAVLLIPARPARAVLFYSTADPSYQTNVPTKAFTNSGWQYVGLWGHFTGTAIAPNFFITTRHIGGSIGDPFIFHGTTNLTTGAYDDAESDLKIWRVNGTLAPIAPVYTKRKERHKGEVVIGRGTQRGAEVRANGVLSGWQWGDYDGVQRWGRSIVASIVPGDIGAGDLLLSVFKAKSASSGVDLSSGDSGGPVFIKDGKFWKLAGVNYGVNALYNTTNSGAGFAASMFDSRGLYVGDGTNWVLVPNLHTKIPGGFYATRISSRTNWINSITQQP